MKISDELRTWALRRFGGQAAPREELDIVADRIDSEMVELPQSADGKTWTGREVCFWTGSAGEDWHKFDGLHYADGRWCVEDSDFERYPAVSVWYERPDSWERIADELEKWCDSTDADGDACDVPRGIADRIRKLAEREASDADGAR